MASAVNGADTTVTAVTWSADHAVVPTVLRTGTGLARHEWGLPERGLAAIPSVAKWGRLPFLAKVVADAVITAVAVSGLPDGGMVSGWSAALVCHSHKAETAGGRGSVPRGRVSPGALAAKGCGRNR